MIGKRVLLGVLIFGVACGVLIGRFAWGGRVHAANKSVDSVTFVVYNAGAQGYKLYLQLDKGDIVHWVLPSFGSNRKIPVYAHFGQATPCVEGSDTPTCTIKSNPRGTYTYTCSDTPNPSGGTQLCTDPGIDPNSSTDGGTIRFPPAEGAATAASAGGGGIGSRASSGIPDLNFDLSCQNNNLTVTATDQNGHVVDASKATSLVAIVWNAHGFVPKITSTPSGVCPIEGNGGVQGCDIGSVKPGDLGKPYSFTMVDSTAAQDGCKNTFTSTITLGK
jgi:hypothetical protein